MISGDPDRAIISGLPTIRSEYGRNTNCLSHRRALQNSKNDTEPGDRDQPPGANVLSVTWNREGAQTSHFVDKNA
jgi:hypothetical protein